MTAHDTCNAIRNCNPRNHDELMTLVTVFAAAIKQSNILSDKATRVVLDMLDSEVMGQIEQDQIDQQAESMWAETNQRAWNMAYSATFIGSRA